MWDFISYIIQVWLSVSVPVYLLWVYCTFKTVKYEPAKHLYAKYGKYSKVVFYAELILCPIITALAWPLQLATAIIDENE